MDRLDRKTKLQFNAMILYFFTLFLPIYSGNFFGGTIIVSIANLNAGTFYVILFLVLILGTMFLRFFNLKYYKIAGFVVIGCMAILALLILINPDGLSIQLTWFIQVMIVTFLLLLHFTANTVFKVLNSIRELTNKLVDFIKGLTEFVEELPTENPDTIEQTDNTEFSDY